MLTVINMAMVRSLRVMWHEFNVTEFTQEENLQRNILLYNAQWPLASLFIYTETFQATGFRKSFSEILVLLE
jgi:hypothetical protein